MWSLLALCVLLLERFLPLLDALLQSSQPALPLLLALCAKQFTGNALQGKHTYCLPKHRNTHILGWTAISTHSCLCPLSFLTFTCNEMYFLNVGHEGCAIGRHCQYVRLCIVLVQTVYEWWYVYVFECLLCLYMYMYAELQDGVQNKRPYGDNKVYRIVSLQLVGNWVKRWLQSTIQRLNN